MFFRFPAFCFSILAAQAAQGQDAYDVLLEKARAGDYAPALNFLRMQAQPSSGRFQIDHVLIAGWAGEDAEVTDVYEQIRDESILSADALATVARAYRNQKLWQHALDTYREGIRRYPAHEGLRLGQVMTLADAGQVSTAIERGQTLLRQAPANPDRRLALAYAYVADGQRFAAHTELDRALSLAPERQDVLREYLFSLQRLGMPQQALELQARYPGILTAAQIRSLQGDALAEQVRLADLPTRAEHERYQIAGRALAQAEKLSGQWQKLPEAQDDLLRLRIDRLGALHTQQRMSDVLEEYEQLQRAGVELPDYALRWVASAALFLRKPELAASLYEQVVAGETDKHPLWMEDQRSLFYARTESGQLEQARLQAEALAQTQSPQRYLQGNPEPLPNANWLDVQVLRAAGLIQVDELPEAERLLSDMLATAPNNTVLRTTLAGLYLERGWPRRAEDELKVAESTAPRDVRLEVEQGFAALDLQEWRQLDLLTDDVLERYPETLPVQRLERLRDIHRMAELRVSAYRGQGSGSAVSGGHDLGIDTLLYSPPIAQDWRLFAGAGYAKGDFDEGTAHHRWQRAGLEWRVRNHTVEAEFSRHDFDHGDKPGFRLSGIHDIDDHWQYGWSAEYLSTQTPLRALNSDVTADSLSGYLRWRADERQEWRLSANAVNFSDGNDRFGLVLDGYKRFYTQPTWNAGWGLELAASLNSSDDDVPYFNPKSELAVMPKVRLQHTLHQRYETRWTQHVELGGGAIYQRYYGTDPAALISYGQRLSLDDRFDAGLGLSALSRSYDGDREHEIRLLFDLNYRF
ncbi:poly-beta-1,6 N-acetyl-D-glucosamine export porin PgaA [Pseudomonas sp. NCCP-436]|nr:poly-beta-1,6 N-acetyl-D-glucosamine export porin PgaA [Pseudomonas sp. NCCP-436]